MGQVPDIEDVFLWPDGSWCHREEVGEYSHKSDDYQILYFGTDEWYKIVSDLGV